MARLRGLAPSCGFPLVALIALVAVAACVRPAATSVEIEVRYSRFVPDEITVPAGVPVTFVLRNEDPIDHEWIVGDEEVHAGHRTGTEPLHAARPTEVVLPALETRSTTVTFDQPGRFAYICHLPAHEAYGMVGTLVVVPQGKVREPAVATAEPVNMIWRPRSSAD